MAIRTRSLRTAGLAALSVLASSTLAPARAQTVFTKLARIDGLQEVPPNPSGGRGLGLFTIDTVSRTIQYRISYGGLFGPETAAHIHGFAPPGVNAGILFGLPLGTPKCGVLTYTAAQEPGILAGQTYVNVHSTAFPGGEIRGQVAEVPVHQYTCFGDGSVGACPCGNNSLPLENEGCLNSLGTGGRLRAYGQALLSADTLVLHYSRGPDSSALLFQGLTLAPAPFGDGIRCVAGSVVRIGNKVACAGTAYWPDLGEPRLSAFVIGPTSVNYQVWYRNAAAFCTAATFNLSNAAVVLWGP